MKNNERHRNTPERVGTMIRGATHRVMALPIVRQLSNTIGGEQVSGSREQSIPKKELTGPDAIERDRVQRELTESYPQVFEAVVGHRPDTEGDNAIVFVTQFPITDHNAPRYYDGFPIKYVPLNVEDDTPQTQNNETYGLDWQRRERLLKFLEEHHPDTFRRVMGHATGLEGPSTIVVITDSEVREDVPTEFEGHRVEFRVIGQPVAQEEEVTRPSGYVNSEEALQ